MKRRNCQKIIAKMVILIPDNEVELLKDLQWNFEDAAYKAPEETIQWERTMKTLVKHITPPSHDWHFEVLSIFTTKSIEELKEELKEWENNVSSKK